MTFTTPNLFNKITIFHNSIKLLNFNLKKILVLNENSIILYFLSVFITIFYVNFLGLFSFIFPFSCVPVFCFTIGLTFWFLYFIINIISNFKKLIRHLVPDGCPIYLIPFIVIIELVSLLTRPITLRVRLIANIRAGHILVCLVSKFIIRRILLILLELIVSIIQAFVFTLLLTLYFNESN